MKIIPNSDDLKKWKASPDVRRILGRRWRNGHELHRRALRARDTLWRIDPNMDRLSRSVRSERARVIIDAMIAVLYIDDGLAEHFEDLRLQPNRRPRHPRYAPGK